MSTSRGGGAPSGPSVPFFDQINRGLNALGTLWLLGLMVLINCDVLGRALFNTPIAGTREIIEVSILGIVYLQLAHALRSGRMTRSDLFIGWLVRRRAPLGHGGEALIGLLGAVFMAILWIHLLPEVTRAFDRGLFHGTRGVFTIPLWPFNAIIVLGSFVTMLQFLFLSGWHVRRAIKGPSAP